MLPARWLMDQALSARTAGEKRREADAECRRGEGEARQEMSRYVLPPRKPPRHQFHLWDTVGLSLTKGLSYTQPPKPGCFLCFQHLFM